jgi:predicted nucleic acid-binding protein
MSEIFVDSSAFIALYDKADALHHKAILLSQKSPKEDINLISSTNIIMETSTLLSMRISHQKAVDFLTDIRNGTIEIVNPDIGLITEAEEIFVNQKSKNVSYSDCICFAIMKEKGINIAFSFDKDFEKNGFRLLR